MPKLSADSVRQRLATIFEDEEPRSTVTRLFNLALALFIIANVSCVILQSVESIGRRFAPAFNIFEGVATAVFAVEYILRVWASVDFRDADYRNPLWGRLRYTRSFFALVDLVAVLPAIIGFFGASNFRVVRLLRLLRMLKLVRHSTTFGLLLSVLREEAQSIGSLIIVLLLTVTIAGDLMYMLEGKAQPQVFTSIPVAMWWAIETLTTVGYGDIVPITALGRILGGFVTIIGIGTLAVFSGLITVGFLDQLKHRHEQGQTSAISSKMITVAQTRGELSSDAAGAATCPHCGAALSRPRAEQLQRANQGLE
jgi:voltage-gated potassium channel